MWTTDNNHVAQLQFHTGRHALERSLSDDRLVGALRPRVAQRRSAAICGDGTPIADCCGGVGGHGASYLGPSMMACHLAIDPKNPLPFAAPGPMSFARSKRASSSLLGGSIAWRRSTIPMIRPCGHGSSRTSWRFACRWLCPTCCSFDDETPSTQRLYGLDQTATTTFGSSVWRPGGMVERGVRFVQIFHGSNGGAGAGMPTAISEGGTPRLCKPVDQPIAGLLKDLKQCGMLDETLVVWGTRVRPHARRRIATAGTTIPLGFRCGWPEAESKEARSTGPPTNWATTPWKTGTM